MVHASTTQRAHVAAGFASAVEALAERFSMYRLYRRTLAEMDGLSDRERSELGFSRQSPRAAAHQAVYGARG